MLSLLGSIYEKIADARNRLYDRGVFETFDLGSRTVSIGNITTGGTGKTPLVAYVANVLAKRGERVCILTRGYGRENPGRRVLVSDGNEIFASVREAGDEPFELAQKLMGQAIVIADGDRVAAAEWAKRKFGATAFVLDDGFQHRRAKRDLDIVCIDATNPFGGGKMLPAGRLREPLDNLKRADVIVITRANMIDDLTGLKFEIAKLAPGKPVFDAENRIVNLALLDDFHTGKQVPRKIEIKEPAFAFCGIGNPENFFEQLRRASLDIIATKSFGDHHEYSQADIDTIEHLAKQSGATSVMTTAKDAVKLDALKFTLPCYIVEIKIEIQNTDEFLELI